MTADAVGQSHSAARTAAGGVCGGAAERDELAVLLRQIEAYEPGVTAKARAWAEQIDRSPRRR